MERRGDREPVEAKRDVLPASVIEVLPIHDADVEALLSFFREGYGRTYQGDDSLRKKIERSSCVITLEDPAKAEGIAATALVAGRRILAMATSPDVTYEGARYDIAVNLLRECVEQLQCQWLTIGQEYSKVQSAAYDAGLRRIHDKELALGLLAEASEESNYSFRYDETNSLLVTRVTSEFRPDYEQQFWVHLPDDI